MSKVQLERIVDNLETVFRGDAWHGPSVMEILQSMPPNVVADKHPSSKYTITQHVYHLLAWRKFVLAKLADEIHVSMATDEENWGTPEQTSQANWPTLLQNLRVKQAELVEKLENFDDSLLDKQVPGEYYTYYKLLTGLIQHDTYHLGMIWVIWE